MKTSTSILARDELAGRKGGIWDYVSPSRINLWLKCPLAFHLRYIEGIRTPPSASQFVGKTVHWGLEIYYRHRQQNVRLPAAEVMDWLLAQWDESVAPDGVRFTIPAAEAAARQQSLDLVQVYLAQLPADEPRPLAIETALEAPLIDRATGKSLGIPLVGVIDLVLPGADGAIITDFKTTSRGGELPELTHELQLSCYSYLFRQTSPLPEEALEIRNLVKTKVPRVENHRYGPRSAAHYLRLFSVIRAYLDALDAGNYYIRPSLLCTACEFRSSHCAQWTG
jgi:putative RecB family exonuclease